MKLLNFVGSQWQEFSGSGDPLVDPVTGEELARVSSDGVDARAALDFARQKVSPALRALSYRERADLLAKMADVFSANRDEYFRISQENLGATQADASFDVDGAIYTIKYYAKIGRALGESKFLKEGTQISLSKTGAFVGGHFLLPTKGVALFINAFNFPAWGLCEKAAPAILSGVPFLIKPATPTAWLAHRMVEDVVKANILPEGAISIVCGSARDLLDHVLEGDMVSFTGSAETAAKVRGNSNVIRRSTRVNIEADSVNSAILGPEAAPGAPAFDLLVKEVVREMTLKAGQKCTAIRRIIVPRAQIDSVAQAIAASLANVQVGNPRNPAVKMGPVVNKAQQAVCGEGIAALAKECSVVFGGEQNFQPVDADPKKSAFVRPTLLRAEKGTGSVNEIEVFGPVATLIPYDSPADAAAIARRGSGSLVASIFSDDAQFVRDTIGEIGDLHGRIMVVDASVAGQSTGHGNVVPSSLHGGPGRAGGGEELAGLRALLLYHRRVAFQGPVAHLNSLVESSASAAAFYE
ncbi:MAG TPA: 3,4-dehydroadipyl-CoA semialdehyde dehydrogenase [Candidatus Acidoferrales bacterium]|nr:3,4-dehydroadipyl-CoA semialdehyde dehydrogenase [Candidatus Acidoferrales bacterium]